MRYASISRLGRISTWLASIFAEPYYSRVWLAKLNPRGFVSYRATIHHSDLQLGDEIFIDDGVLIYKDKDGGPVILSNGVHIHRNTIIQSGASGSIIIGDDTHIQPQCILSAYVGVIRIGASVEIAPYCTFYPYKHGTELGKLIMEQPLHTKGGINIGDDVWLGVGVTVLDGVSIGKGAIIGAGAVVVSDIPENSIAVGIPARVVQKRG